jgi:glycosyltransferase involved in cell wall biosynthesis
MYKLTVIICVFNEEFCLLDALRSLYANKIYPQTEVMIIDDCSTKPFTLRMLGLLEKFTRFNIVRSARNLGLSNSRNLGFKNATTPYILPLDADDVFPDGTLDTVYKIFTDNPDAGYIVGDYYLQDVQTGETKVVDCSHIATNNIVDIKKLATDWKLLGTSPCKKATWEKVGGYNLKYSYSIQDVDFWIRVITTGARGLYLNLPIYTWKRSVTGMNMNFNRLDMIKLLEDHRGFYLLTHSAQQLNDRIFEAYYPYKQKNVLLPIGRKHFFQLKLTNQIRLISFYLKSIFNAG